MAPRARSGGAVARSRPLGRTGGWRRGPDLPQAAPASAPPGRWPNRRRRPAASSSKGSAAHPPEHQKVGIRRREKSCLTRAAAAARRGGGATNPAVSGTTPTHSSGRRRWSAAAATPSSSTASRAQQPRHRNGIGVVMRRSEARGLGGAHACRRRDYLEAVTSRSVAEEPTMMATSESEIGSPGHDGVVRGRGGCRVGSRAHQQLPGESLNHGTSSTDAPPTQGWPEGVSPRTFGGLSSADGLFVRRARTAAIVVGCFDRG